MLVQGIKSRPVYSGLDPDPQAKSHLVAVQGEGALALLDMLARAPDRFLACTRLLYVDDKAAGDQHPLAALQAQHVTSFPTIPALLNQWEAALDCATMGTRLYVSGTEGFIGQVIQRALDHGVSYPSIRTEHRGSLARRVQCVHCKTILENVTTSIVVCPQCHANLLVRDHYSRRLAAFMGVAADAEKPGLLPPIHEIFK
jgi:predicted RNA-binding Zn-ribbon protein involved in translation (DUF1610 family)